MDCFVLRKVLSQIEGTLKGALVSKVYQPAKKVLLLELWKPGISRSLVLSAHPLLCSIHLTNEKYKNPPSPPRFCQALRKHLTGKRIASLELAEFERYLTIHFVSKRGDEMSPYLIAELFGRNGNIILTDGSFTILNALQIIPTHKGAAREVVSGAPYSLLPPPSKTFLPHVTEDTCRSILAENWDSLEEGLYRKVHGLSKEIISRIPTGSIKEPGELAKELNSLVQRYHQERYEVGIRDEGKGPFKRSLVPLFGEVSEEEEITPFPSPNEGAESFFHLSFMEEKMSVLRNHIGRIARKGLKKETTRLKRVKDDIAKFKSFSHYKMKGELLKQALHSVTKGNKECSVTNYYKDPPEKMIIDLDPALSPVENMNRYFRLYRKGQKGIAFKKKYLPSIEDEIGYYRSLLYYMERAESLEELGKIQREMGEGGLIPTKPSKGKRGKGTLRRREARTSQIEKFIVDSFTIYAGKNNHGNDHIIQNIASPGDLWLHAMKHPGSHVLIKKRGDAPIPDEVIYTCAGEAARRSGGAGEGKLDVYVADAKDVRKIPGQKPGVVRIRRFRSVLVALEKK